MVQIINIVDKILPSGRISWQYFQYVHTIFRSLLSQYIENEPITSLKYNFGLLQNERNRAFGILVLSREPD